MNVEIGAEAALFPEKEYINGIFVAVYCKWFIEGQAFLRSYDTAPRPHDRKKAWSSINHSILSDRRYQAEAIRDFET
jgi:hypothetical protein